MKDRLAPGQILCLHRGACIYAGVASGDRLNPFLTRALNHIDQNVSEPMIMFASGALPLVRLLLSPRLDVVWFELQDLGRFNMMS